MVLFCLLPYANSSMLYTLALGIFSLSNIFWTFLQIKSWSFSSFFSTVTKYSIMVNVP